MFALETTSDVGQFGNLHSHFESPTHPTSANGKFRLVALTPIKPFCKSMTECFQVVEDDAAPSDLPCSKKPRLVHDGEGGDKQAVLLDDLLDEPHPTAKQLTLLADFLMGKECTPTKSLKSWTESTPLTVCLLTCL